MSLQLAAQHLSNQGRGPDDTLVHMSRNEVKSLNDLAMAHGGQLTINPQTGLPEAGFLSSILPMVAGAALTGLSGGAINPLTAGLIVGGGSMLLNPKAGLMGGLMAGLGAYGGGGLGQGLSGLATSEAGTTVANNATEAAAKAEAEAASARNLEIANQQAGQKAAENSLVGRTDLTRAQMENALMPQNQLQPLTAEQIQPIRDNAMMQSMANAPKAPTGLEAIYQGAKSALDSPSKLKDIGGVASLGLAAAAPAASALLKPTGLNMPTTQQKAQVVPHYKYTPGMATPTPAASATGVENTYFQPKYTALSNEEAASLYPGYPAAQAANGGLMGYAAGGPVEQMSNNAAIGANTMYPMANMTTSAFATPYQDPRSTNMMQSMAPAGGGTVDQMSGEPNMQGTRLASGGVAKYGFGGFLGDAVSNIGSAIGHIGKSDSGGDPEGWKKLLENMGGKQPDSGQTTAANVAYNPNTQQYQQMATGGLSDAHYNLGGYSDGGRLLRGPGDGVSDSIPAVIGKKQPARLADGEFVVPARIVSELGNGSTEAGARKLYAMMDRIQAARKNTVGKGKVAKNNRADKYLPA